MAGRNYGTMLDPKRTLKVKKGVKGERKVFNITNNPSTIDQGQLLVVEFPNLSSQHAIIPGSVKLNGTVKLSGNADTGRIVVDNYGRNRFKQMIVKIGGHEIINVDNYHILGSWLDLWKSVEERRVMYQQGVLEDGGGMSLEVLRHRVDAGDKDETKVKEKKLADVYGNIFSTPLDFEILTTTMPFYQSGLNDRLEFHLTMNKYGNIIKASDKENSKIKESNLQLEFSLYKMEG